MKSRSGAQPGFSKGDAKLDGEVVVVVCGILGVAFLSQQLSISIDFICF